VIEVVIAVEINRQSMSMRVIIAERLTLYILPCQFRAMTRVALVRAPNDGTMK
jgi:hypothetical protein